MTRRRTVALLVLCGILDLPSGVYFSALGVGEPRYTYESYQVEFENGSMRYADRYDDEIPHRPIENLDCAVENLDWICLSQAAVRENVTLTVPVAASPINVRTSDLVFLGGFYERVATEVENGSRLELKRVPKARALERISVRAERAQPRAVRVVEAGTLTTTDPIEDDVDTLITMDGSQYVVRQEEFTPAMEYRDRKRMFLSLLSIVAGLGLLLRAHRIQMEMGRE